MFASTSEVFGNSPRNKSATACTRACLRRAACQLCAGPPVDQRHTDRCIQSPLSHNLRITVSRVCGRRVMLLGG